MMESLNRTTNLAASKDLQVFATLENLSGTVNSTESDKNILSDDEQAFIDITQLEGRALTEDERIYFKHRGFNVGSSEY